MTTDKSTGLLEHHMLQPTLQAAVTIQQWSKETVGETELAALVNELNDRTNAVVGGDLTRAEATLAAQGHVLDNVFNTLMRRAINAKRASTLETYLRLGLRAQNQCRATLETLAGMKNPKAVSIRQANIAHGPQQVNNEVHAEPVHKKIRKIAGERSIDGAARWQTMAGHRNDAPDSGC